MSANTLNEVYQQIKDIQQAARAGKSYKQLPWPMIVLHTPKSWTAEAAIKMQVA